MISVQGYDGTKIAVLGLGRSGLATAHALRAGGAEALCWDDDPAARAAAQALGFGSVWVTGPNATEPHVRAALGVAVPNQIIGFLHMGTARIPAPTVTRPDPAQFVEYWTGHQPQ